MIPHSEGEGKLLKIWHIVDPLRIDWLKLDLKFDELMDGRGPERKLCKSRSFVRGGFRNFGKGGPVRGRSREPSASAGGGPPQKILKD